MNRLSVSTFFHVFINARLKWDVGEKEGRFSMAECRELMLGEIDVPLPFPPRVVHVYLIKHRDNVILIDLGPRTQSTMQSLEQGLQKHDLSLEDVTHVIFTHSHVDHAGCAATFRDRNPTADVYMHQKELEYHDILRHQKFEKISEVFGSLDQSIQDMFLKMDGYYSKMKSPINPTHLISGSQFKLMIDDLELEFIHVPGHTPGSMVIYLPSKNLLFTGDHVIAHISPIITYSDFEFDGLGMYMDSLRKLQPLTVKEAWPAHGAKIQDLSGRVNELLQHHDQRLQEVHRIIEKIGKPIWPLDLIPELFDANLPLNQYPLAFFEVLAHLIHLQNIGSLEYSPKKGWMLARQS